MFFPGPIRARWALTILYCSLDIVGVDGRSMAEAGVGAVGEQRLASHSCYRRTVRALFPHQSPRSCSSCHNLATVDCFTAFDAHLQCTLARPVVQASTK